MTTKTEPNTTDVTNACPESPTGAHHWIIGMPEETMSGECKYCHASRAFRPYQETTGFNNSHKKLGDAA